MLQRLHKAFLENKSNNAFCIEDIYYTYSEVYSLTVKIAQLLKDNPSGSDVIGIIVSNNVETYAAILACWFSGKAYVPINPQLPEGRNKLVLESANVHLLLNCAEDDVNYDDLRVFDVLHIEMGDVTGVLTCTDREDDSLMYVLFTSGSTGLPKGVPINYKNLHAFLASYEALGFAISASDRFLQMFEFTFDVSVASFLVPLMYGACVYTVPAAGVKYVNVIKTLRDKQITVACLVPSIITYMKPYFDRLSLPAVKYCILTAEASNIYDIIKWKACIPNSEVYNLYGPTEATIWCTAYRLDTSTPKSYNDMMAIGKPLQQVKAVIIDEAGNLASNNIKGQLCIAGKQITSGYINNQQKNTESFIALYDEQYYKTGDLCYVDEEGDIYYCGRMDYQVKVNGHRIELGEIEAMVRRLFAVNNIAILYRDKDGIDKIFLMLEDFDEIDDVKAALKKELPYYMLPHVISSMKTFPINNSNKIDRIALKTYIEQYNG
ncbi:MAG TPA: amino acid adenylation domain-containing protein [Flavipsychrobacter sp.]